MEFLCKCSFLEIYNEQVFTSVKVYYLCVVQVLCVPVAEHYVQRTVTVV